MNSTLPGQDQKTRLLLTPAVLLNFLIASVMISCLIYATVQILEHTLFDWSGRYIPFLAFLVAMESLISYRQLQQIYSSSGWIPWRLAEFVVLAVLLRLALLLLHGPSQWLAELRTWQTSFSEGFFSDEFLIAIGLSLVAWFLGLLFAERLYELEENTEQWDLERIGVTVRDRVKIRKSLMTLIFSLGAALLALLAFLSLDISFLPDQWIGIRIHTIVFLAYFVLGFVLLSQTQYNVLHARWYLQNLPQQPILHSRWSRYSILLIFLVAVIVVFLPTAYSISLMDILRALFTVIMFIGLVLQFLILSPFILLISWISQFFGQSVNFSPQVPQLPQQTPAPPTGTSMPWLEVLRSVLFWVVFIGVVWFSFRYYVRQHSETARSLSRFSITRWMIRLAGWIRSLFTSAGKMMERVMTAGRSRLKQASRSALGNLPARLPGFAHLSPRQQILFIYLSMVLWLNQNGVARKSSSTPSEFSQKLSGVIPSAQAEIHSITGLFMEARYTRHAIQPDQSAQAKTDWERIQRLFKEQQEKTI